MLKYDSYIKKDNQYMAFLEANGYFDDQKYVKILSRFLVLCEHLVEICNRSATDINSMVGKSNQPPKLLPFSVLDYSLTIVYDYLVQYYENKEFSWPFIASILFQITGEEDKAPSSTSAIEMFGAPHIRGLQKYQVAIDKLKDNFENPIPWFFLTEVANIFTDGPDSTIIATVMPYLPLVEYDIGSIMNYYLYGKNPDMEYREELIKKLFG